MNSTSSFVLVLVTRKRFCFVLCTRLCFERVWCHTHEKKRVDCSRLIWIDEFVKWANKGQLICDCWSAAFWSYLIHLRFPFIWLVWLFIRYNCMLITYLSLSRFRSIFLMKQLQISPYKWNKKTFCRTPTAD